MDSDSSVENHPPETKRRKSSKGCRRSRSNPQIRPRHLAELAVDSRSGLPPRHSPDQYRSTGMKFAIGSEYYSPPAVFRAGNLCAVAGPLNQRSTADSRNFLPSYLMPLSDQPSSSYWVGNAGMIKSKSLDKLDEIMRNDPILRDDYLGASPSSKSTQTQTETVYRKKKPRRKRNDRPRSQILPPTYLQLPSVTWLPNKLGSYETSKETTPSNEPSEVPNDCYFGPSYSRAIHRRKSKEEQAQIVQRWINEMIEHKRAQELRRQSLVRQSLGKERSTKLKKKSRSVPEHTFRGNQSRFERRRSTDDSEEINWEYGIPDAKLRHSGSDPSFKSPVSGDNRYLSVSTSSIGAASTQTVGTSTATDENISPSLQSRIRRLEQSFQQNNTSGSSLQSNNNNSDSAKPLGRNRSESSPKLVRRTKASNLDLPLISHLLSGGELDSQC